MSLCRTLVFCSFFSPWLSVSLDLIACVCVCVRVCVLCVALGCNFYPYLYVQECDTSRNAFRNFYIFRPEALKKCVWICVCVYISVCTLHLHPWLEQCTYVCVYMCMCVAIVGVGGWGRIHGNTPPPPPLGPKRQSLTHTHTHTHTEHYRASWARSIFLPI